MLAGCSESEELALRQSESSQEGRIDFTVYASRNTRAGQPGEMNMTALQGAGAGFGVFAYYTDNTFYDERSSVADFMYNQPVTWSGQRWTYDPVKYWPNEFGSNAASQGIDYVTFFAYAPFVDFDPVTGAAPAGDDPDQQQWKNITSASRSTDQGDPWCAISSIPTRRRRSTCCGASPQRSSRAWRPVRRPHRRPWGPAS